MQRVTIAALYMYIGTGCISYQDFIEVCSTNVVNCGGEEGRRRGEKRQRKEGEDLV